MGFLDSLKAWLKTETAELSDAKRGLEGRLDEGLSKRERQLNETQAEAMERLQQEIADGESSFHDIEDKIGHTHAKADAVADLGRPEEIGNVFSGFQKYLYQDAA